MKGLPITSSSSGIRFTSCRDGLAKTAMSITLEQTRILARDYDLKEAEFLKTLNLIRRCDRHLLRVLRQIMIMSFFSVGLHGEKCMKNTNTNKFTMSSLELQNNLSGFETNVPILWKLDGLRRGVMRMFRECFLMPKKHRKNMQRSEKIIQYCMLIFWFCINNLFFSHIYPNLR